MEQLYFKAQPYQGLQQVVGAADGGLMAFDMVKLKSGESCTELSGIYEIALVILSGQANIAVDGEEFKHLGQRKDVFSGTAATVYIPRDSSFRVESLSDDFEAALCKVEAEKKFKAFAVTPEQVIVNHRGGLIWQRDVHDIITDNGEGNVDRIVVGETFSNPGNWSSFPPHKHDRYVPGEETKLAEIYHFRVSPANGFGIQVLYSEDRELDEAVLIRDMDTVNIPFGYHPVVAPPSVKVYYLWFMAGTLGRKLVPHDDPDFVELRQLETKK
ncbi:MAG: 5-deoxy-glucuronate isomerase [Peptococcaceae bacterium]|nr:5-deoxy-glucuronate isomerase [Peptococcaceae bacterium]